MTAPPPVLAQILDHKRAEVAHAKAARPLADVKAHALDTESPRNFFAAVTRAPKGKTSIIAEIKRKSPTAGLIRDAYAGDGFRPEDIARTYHAAGAAALSCLTDREFFGGDLSFLARVRGAVPLPVLRKDFIIDPWQVWESRAAGADAVLLIAECLTESLLIDLLILSHELRLTALVEVHSEENLARVLPHLGFPHQSYALLGINNRDLSSMTTDLSHSLRLSEHVENRWLIVSESGIRTPQDLRLLRRSGIQIALVGEHLMRHADPGEALKTLLAPPEPKP